MIARDSAVLQACTAPTLQRSHLQRFLKLPWRCRECKEWLGNLPRQRQGRSRATGLQSFQAFLRQLEQLGFI